MRKIIAFIILAVFCMNTCVAPACAATVPGGAALPAGMAGSHVLMPEPGVMVGLSPVFRPPLLTGVKVYADEPFRLDFIFDPGDGKAEGTADARRLIRYFLASLTVPEKDLWVNLSPYEKDRIVPDVFGHTEMGRDLLAQDYLLKQITSSLMYPDDRLGREFWADVYRQAQEQFGTTDIPVDTFNKVWIVPETAVVYEKPDTAGGRGYSEAVAYVVRSRLKVMLESDYLAMKGGHLPVDQPPAVPDGSMSAELTKQALRQIIVPALEKEVNEGRNFAALRQVYHSLILASWYKKKMKASLLSAVYVDRQKVRGVAADDPDEAVKIWARYVEAFRTGVFDLVREEQDVSGAEPVPRKYFAGGMTFMAVDAAMDVINSPEALKDHGMIAPEEAFLIRMNLRAEPPEGDLPADNPIFFSQEAVYDHVLQAAGRLKEAFVQNGFDPAPAVIAEFGKAFKIMTRRGIWNVDDLVHGVDEQLLKERRALSARPGYIQKAATQFFGRMAGLLRGDPLHAYLQQDGQQVEQAKSLFSKWAGLDLDGDSILFDYRLSWNSDVKYTHSQFIRMTILPVQFGVSLPMLLHESWHQAARGFDADWLNEALTQRLALDMLDLEGRPAPRSFRVKYQREQRMLRLLSGVTGGYAPIMLAYLTGDTRLLFRTLGPHADLVWRLFESLDEIGSSTVVKEQMLSAVLRNLDSREDLIRLGRVFHEQADIVLDDPWHISPFIARDLKKPLMPSPQIADLKKDLLERPVSENVLLERSITAYIEGFPEKDLFIDDEETPDVSLNDLAEEAGRQDHAEAMPLFERLELFMKGAASMVPGGVDSMGYFIDAFNEPDSLLGVYRNRMAEYLKEEEDLAFKLLAERSGGRASMLTLLLGDEDPFAERPREDFDADVLNAGVVTIETGIDTSRRGKSHWQGWHQISRRGGIYDDSLEYEDIRFVERPFLEGKPTPAETERFIERISQRTVNGYRYRPVGNWGPDRAPIRCDVNDPERKFYLMDPWAVRAVAGPDKAQAPAQNMEDFIRAAGEYWKAMSDLQKKVNERDYDSLAGLRSKRESLESVIRDQGYFLENTSEVDQNYISEMSLPPVARFRVWRVMAFLKENIDQHVFGQTGLGGSFMVSIDRQAGRVFMAMMDNGPGFPVDMKTGKPLVMLHERDGVVQVVQREGSPGRGEALGKVNLAAEELRVFTRGYMRDLKQVTELDNDLQFQPEYARTLGTMVVVRIDFTPDDIRQQAVLDSMNGGIDLSTGEEIVQTAVKGEGMIFNIDPAALERLNAASGFTPVITSIEIMNNISGFLGLPAAQLN